MSAPLEGTEDLRPLIIINDRLAIPANELEFRFSRSSGPGGQHVQRSDTRVELLFNVANSPSLTPEQRARITARLGNHIDGEGVLRVVSSTTRSQLENREDAVSRFQGLLAGALRQQKRRIATKPSAGAREARLTEKKVRAQHKAARRKVRGSDYE
jgi:ribosome-associated protein